MIILDQTLSVFVIVSNSLSDVCGQLEITTNQILDAVIVDTVKIYSNFIAFTRYLVLILHMNRTKHSMSS